eukprot:1161126-Pelagomonas_calceolata.AAC.2
MYLPALQPSFLAHLQPGNCCPPGNSGTYNWLLTFRLLSTSSAPVTSATLKRMTHDMKQVTTRAKSGCYIEAYGVFHDKQKKGRMPRLAATLKRMTYDMT